MPRINHFIVLMLENRSFDHLFGFFPPPAGETIENLLALHSPAVNLLDPSRPESADNPAFEASQPAPFAVVFGFDRIGLRVPAVIVSPWIAKSTVEHRMLQHTSIIKTVNEIFGLNGPLNRRDESARSFADLFDVADQPRSAKDMPERLNWVPLDETVESVVAGVPLHPADEPLDDLTRDWALGMLSLLSGGLESVEEPPATQGEAAAAIEAKLEAAGL